MADEGMRLDKFLKVSRIIKRRQVANDVCTAGRVTVNGRAAKPSVRLKEGDEVYIEFGNGTVGFRILSLKPVIKKEDADSLYELL